MPSTRRSAATCPRRRRSRRTRPARDLALADTYRLTRELARFPRPDRFVELQIELAEALEREATAARLPTGTRPAD